MDPHILISFVIEAVAALRYQLNQLFQQLRDDAFFLTLETHLRHVQSRLERRTSCDIDRVLLLLEALERLAKVASPSPYS